LLKNLAELSPPITDVIKETRWWAGFHQDALPAQGAQTSTGIRAAGETYVAPAKVGRNDPCPCGSGKKFKKCCGASESVGGPGAADV
jgi:uncharacterized protein YchJ